MTHRFTDSESEANSKVSSDDLDDTLDLASKYKSNLPINKKKKPKRNRSAFIIFSSEMRAKIRSEQKEKLNSNEMMTKLATMWKDLPEDEKKHFFDIAEKEKVRYLLELNDFYQNYPYEVIQNKTKKNHVKKPCSAYALYLQEMKKSIKTTNPELKMADILKLVGERWKNLSEGEKSVYQQKAQAEKEVTKAKLNEHMLRDIEELKKAPIPQKRVQSHKRIQKALLKENAKLDPYFREHIIQESFRAKGDEPMLRKQQMTSSYNPRQPSFDFDFNNFSSLLNLSGEKIDNNNFFQSRMGSTTDPNLNKEASFLLNLCETTTKIAKRSSDLIFDLIKFQSQNENAPSVSESTINSSTGAVGERVNNNVNLSSRAQAMNDTLINCLNFEPNSDFNFESLDNEANFDEIIQYWN